MTESHQTSTESVERVEICQPTSANTGPFINLPGEVRNLIYRFTINTCFSPDRLPNPHLLPSGSSLGLTCRQIYHEVHQIIDSNILVYALHTMKIRFFQELPLERVKLMKAVILTDSKMGDSWRRYYDWRHGIYECVIEKLCSSEFHPTTLIFCTDHCHSQPPWDDISFSSQYRKSQFTDALHDLRFALSTMHTIRTVFLIDVGAPATRDVYADLFEKCFPSHANRFTAEYYDSVQWDVQRERIPVACDAIMVDEASSNKDERKFKRIMRIEEAANADNTADFRLTIKKVDLPPCEVAVHIFAHWLDFCKAYDGPFRPPKRDGKWTPQFKATKYSMRQPSWHRHGI
jgi:hypothetical protein